jgi:hypothetical protein
MFDNGTRYAFNVLRLVIVGKLGSGEIIMQESDGHIHFLTRDFVQKHLTLAID